MPPCIDRTDQKYGWLIAREKVGRNKHNEALWRCDCTWCGGETVVTGKALSQGNNKSCGCRRSLARAERQTTHGQAALRGRRTRAYICWSNMIQRCTNPHSQRWSSYGGRGISVCDRWRSFENFYADMGDPPEGLSIDRIDVNGNYEPSNCRWADSATQAKNKRPRVPQAA